MVIRATIQAASSLFKISLAFQLSLFIFQATLATSLRIKNETTIATVDAAGSNCGNTRSCSNYTTMIDREIFFREATKDYKWLIRDDVGNFQDGVAAYLFDQYITELRGRSFKPLVKETTIDERLANMLYVVTTKRVLSIDFAKFDSGDPNLDSRNEYLATSDRVDDQLCGKHLNEMVRLLDEYESKLEQKRSNSSFTFDLDARYLHLTRLLDSFGRYESGFLNGRTHSMGNYEQCLASPLILDPVNAQETVASRFCWARLDVEKNLDRTLRERNKLPFEGKSSVLSVGICIPETCHTRHFAQYKQLFQRIVDSQFRLPKSMYIDETLELDSVFCIVDENSRIGVPTSGWVLIGLVALWTLLTLCATIWRHRVKLIENDKLRKVLICMDLRNSWFEFTTKPAPAPLSTKDQGGRRVELNTLNPIRWFGCVFVVFGHAILMKGGYLMNIFQGLERTEVEFIGGFIIVGTAVVDTFFALTAMIAAYITLRRAHRQTYGRNQATKPAKNGLENNYPLTIRVDTSEGKQKQDSKEEKQVNSENDTNHKKASSEHGPPMFVRFVAASLKVIESRYFRLLPMLILAYWFKRSVFIYSGVGPFWDYGFNHETANGACQQESWLVPFTVTSSFIPLSRQCLMQSWSVSNDMFFFLVAAPIMIIGTRKPKVSAAVLVGMCIASINALITAIQNSDPSDDFEIRDLRSMGMFSLFGKNSYIYSYPHYRVGAFAIGLFAGYALYCYDTKKIEQWPSWFKGPATTLSVVYLVGLLVVLPNGGKFKGYLTPYHYFLYPWYMTLGKILWAASNSILFLRMATDWNRNAWMKSFSSKFWLAAAKLNYAILLIHYDLLQYNEITPTQTNVADYWSIYQSFSTVYITSTLLSLIVHIIFENPMDKLVRSFILRTKSK